MEDDDTLCSFKIKLAEVKARKARMDAANGGPALAEFNAGRSEIGKILYHGIKGEIAYYETLIEEYPKHEHNSNQ